MNKSEYDKKWLNNELSEKEKKAFSGTEEHRFLTKLQGALNQFRAPEYDLIREGKRLEDNFQPKQGRGINWPSTLFKVAASMLLLITFYVIYELNDSPIQEPVSVYASQKTSLHLPDSSYVALNAKTRFSYDWTNTRTVQLSGEAFFNVIEGSKFDVITDFGTVSVMGTQFNVEVWEDFFEVICFEGSVKIQADTKEIVLNKRESWRLVDGEAESSKDKIGDLPDWQNSESRFQSIPLKHVLKELERQYDVTVITDNVDLEQEFTGAFPHDNINLALKSISVPLTLSYRLEENKVQITRDQ